ncbi:hypothetical protein LAV79_14980 [Peribacillus butanolivorans]|uniref:hypothetical protein n=1 Tax=Peribacillus butanolivorans TaxID=421767 RepID=UPI0030C9E3CC
MSSAFLDATPHTNPKSTEVDYGATKVWNGMPKEEYQKVNVAEEQKYYYEWYKPIEDEDEYYKGSRLISGVLFLSK